MIKTRNHSALAFFLFLVLITTGAAAQHYSVLYNFGQSSQDPVNPSYSGILAQGRDGNLYGTVAYAGGAGGGSMIKVTPSGKLSVVYNFDGAVGFAPFGALTGTATFTAPRKSEAPATPAPSTKSPPRAH